MVIFHLLNIEVRNVDEGDKSEKGEEEAQGGKMDIEEGEEEGIEEKEEGTGGKGDMDVEPEEKVDEENCSEGKQQVLISYWVSVSCLQETCDYLGLCGVCVLFTQLPPCMQKLRSSSSSYLLL